jgi:hypothetical protein
MSYVALLFPKKLGHILCGRLGYVQNERENQQRAIFLPSRQSRAVNPARQRRAFSLINVHFVRVTPKKKNRLPALTTTTLLLFVSIDYDTLFKLSTLCVT